MNIKIFNNDLPPDLNLSDEKEVALDNEALGFCLLYTSDAADE